LNSNRPPQQDFAQRPSTAFQYLLLFLLVALVLRVALFRFFPSIYWADEIFQTQEAAHRLAYGPAVVTWEYRLGMRSWFLPLVIAGIMKCTAWLGAGSTGYVFATALFFSLVSLLAVWFAFSWCRRYFGLQYALLAAFTSTIWFELINFGPRALSEVIAGNLLLPAIYWGSLDPVRKPQSKWRLVLIGLLLGLTVCLRIQFGPAVLLAGLWIMSRDWKTRFLPVTLGIFFVVLVFGILDAVTWSFPFYSYVAYFRENILYHKAAEFSVLPWYYFFAALFVHAGPLALFALVGLRRSPILGWISLAVLLPHSLIAHKEFRYIYPVLPLLLPLASIGLIDSLQAVEKWTKWRSTPQIRVLIAATFVLASSFALASKFPRWAKARGGLRAFSRLSVDSQACALAVYQVHWWDTGGYTYLHRAIPIFLFSESRDLDSVAQSFNRIVAPEAAGEPLPGYSVSSCSDGICVYQRSGACEKAGSQFEINEYLKQNGQ
jgi:hypothetical protein